MKFYFKSIISLVQLKFRVKMKILYLLFYVFVVLAATEPHKRVVRRQATGWVTNIVTKRRFLLATKMIPNDNHSHFRKITNPFVQTRREAMIRRRLAREPPRDCSDAPDENIKTTCLMVSDTIFKIILDRHYFYGSVDTILSIKLHNFSRLLDLKEWYYLWEIHNVRSQSFIDSYKDSILLKPPSP